MRIARQGRERVRRWRRPRERPEAQALAVQLALEHAEHGRGDAEARELPPHERRRHVARDHTDGARHGSERLGDRRAQAVATDAQRDAVARRGERRPDRAGRVGHIDHRTRHALDDAHRRRPPLWSLARGQREHRRHVVGDVRGDRRSLRRGAERRPAVAQTTLATGQHHRGLGSHAAHPGRARREVGRKRRRRRRVDARVGAVAWHPRVQHHRLVMLDRQRVPTARRVDGGESAWRVRGEKLAEREVERRALHAVGVGRRHPQPLRWCARVDLRAIARRADVVALRQRAQPPDNRGRRAQLVRQGHQRRIARDHPLAHHVGDRAEARVVVERREDHGGLVGREVRRCAGVAVEVVAVAVAVRASQRGASARRAPARRLRSAAARSAWRTTDRAQPAAWRQSASAP